MTNQDKALEWEVHRENWKTHCSLSRGGRRQVFGKGSLFAKFLFVGEAPGKLEEIEGVPFVGQSGLLLEKAIEKTKVVRSLFFTNLVCARPSGERGDNRPPSFRECESCLERFLDVIRILNPTNIVLLGKVAERFILARGAFFASRRVFCLRHPSWILRNGGEKGKEFKLYVRRLRSVLKCM